MYVVGFAETVVEMLNVRNGLIEVLTHMWVCVELVSAVSAGCRTLML